jgi:hypothetical protein
MVHMMIAQVVKTSNKQQKLADCSIEPARFPSLNLYPRIACPSIFYAHVITRSYIYLGVTFSGPTLSLHEAAYVRFSLGYAALGAFKR